MYIYIIIMNDEVWKEKEEKLKEILNKCWLSQKIEEILTGGLKGISWDMRGYFMEKIEILWNV